MEGMTMSELSVTTTHPATAWLISATPPALVAAALLVAALLLRGRLALALSLAQAKMAARRRGGTRQRPDSALIWTPTTIDPGRAVAICAGAVAAVSAALSLAAPIFLALAMAAPLAAALIWALLAMAEARYVSSIDRDLTAALGRMSALLKSGSGFRTALERVLADMQAGPLRDEWGYLLTRQGVNLASGGIATPQQVVSALAEQTTSARQATLLSHLSVAVGQPQDVLARRCEAAYAAIQASDRRREEAVTELAQMRYSGMAVGLAGITMAAYLVLTQWERVVAAYSTPLGAVVGAVVIFSLALPIIGGLLLARADDVDY
jgi:Flp pilus assembly protein TadB